MEETEKQAVIESILFASGEPVGISKIASVMEIGADEVKKIAQSLADFYNFNRRGIKLIMIDGKLQLCTRPEYAPYIRRALETRRPPSLSQAALETLAIVAYRQPVTRAYVEQVRGVDSSGTMTSLAEKGLIEECGKLEAPGRPSLFRTTDGFLRSFGISGISELPKIENNEDEQLHFELDSEAENHGQDGCGNAEDLCRCADDAGKTKSFDRNGVYDNGADEANADFDEDCCCGQPKRTASDADAL